jgi:alkylation response protein AidB-like acyl-CoA dehydrogenase
MRSNAGSPQARVNEYTDLADRGFGIFEIGLGATVPIYYYTDMPSPPTQQPPLDGAHVHGWDADRLRLLREEFRAWLEENLPPEWRDITRGTPDERAVPIRRGWGERLAAGRWAAPGWPELYGGRDLPIEAELVVLEELVRAGAPEALNSNGIAIVGPLLIRYGTQEQIDRFLLPMLDHSELWCQGFSEPNAGSDLANLQTRARLEDDNLVLSGQKIWTSFAERAQFCYALVRTDATGPKHAGISLVILDMRQPGVTVRSLRNIAGGAEFAEVFLDDAVVPRSHVIGQLHQGWDLAMEALSLERGLSFAERALRFRREISNAIRLVRSFDPPSSRASSDPGLPAHLLDCYIDSRLLTSAVGRVLRLIHEPERVGTLAALTKLHWSESHQELLGLVVAALETRAADEGAEWLRAFLFSRGETIYGGTSEIQRNQIARGIGLPSSSRSARADAAPPRVRAAGLAVGDEQDMLRDGFESMLSSVLSKEVLDAARESDGFSPPIWSAVAEAGWFGLGADGGDMADAVTLLHLAESVGAHLLPGPFSMTTAMVVPLLSAHPEATGSVKLDDVLSGRTLATVVMPDGGTPAFPRWTSLQPGYEPEGGLRLSGRAEAVPFGQLADHFLVPIELGERVVVATVSRGHAGVTVAPRPTVDPARPAADLVLQDVAIGPDSFLGGWPCDLHSLVVKRLMAYMICLDGECLGGAEEMLRRTITYVSQREQFGVPVGSFQAVKHMLADAYVELELARGHAYDVAMNLGDDEPADELGLACSRRACGRMYPLVVERCIQAHGGAGFTWEQELHFWYRAALEQRNHPFPPHVLAHAASCALERAETESQR